MTLTNLFRIETLHTKGLKIQIDYVSKKSSSLIMPTLTVSRMFSEKLNQSGNQTRTKIFMEFKNKYIYTNLGHSLIDDIFMIWKETKQDLIRRTP